MVRKKLFILILLTFSFLNVYGQSDATEDSLLINSLHQQVLTDGKAYEWLEYLSTKIGHRLSGSPQLMAATTYARNLMDGLHLDNIWLQPCQVPYWIRGTKEVCRVVSSPRGNFDLSVLALGNTTGTGHAGVQGQVLKVYSLDELSKLPDSEVKDKIVFFNRAWDETLVNTFQGYGRTVDQRSRGPRLAASKGAAAVLVRSVSTGHDDEPHTGGTFFRKGDRQIPAFALGHKSSELLTQLVSKGKTEIFLQSTSEMRGTADGYNIIGEIKGREFPEEIIIVAAHIDTWDVGDGSHDDGAGCVQSLEVARLFKAINYKPKRTIRIILYTNEENGIAGALAYRDYADKSDEKHIMAIESDAGGHSPHGFFYEAESSVEPSYTQLLNSWQYLMDTYGYVYAKGGSGVDIGPLKPHKLLLMGLMPDSQRYFDYHHSHNDTFDKVNRRELHLGAAAMASIVYLVDKYGTGQIQK